MLVKTTDVQIFLTNRGFTKDDSEPSIDSGCYVDDNTDEFLIIDESYSDSDLQHIIEDAEGSAPTNIAPALREWHQEIQNKQQ